MKRYHVHRSATVILDWQVSELLNGFTFPWEQRAAPKTEFRALWDDERLHFRFDCVDDDLVLGSGKTLKERVLGSDRVEIFLAPNLSLDPYFCFEMEPRGEVLAYSGRFHRQFDWGWSCSDLNITANVAERFYSIQGSLALGTLRTFQVLKPDNREFLIGVYRAEFSQEPDGSILPGWMSWVHPRTERPDFHVPTAFGLFELMA